MLLLREDAMLREPRSWLEKAELLFMLLEGPLNALLFLGLESRETCRLAILSVLPLIRFEGALLRLRSLVDGLCLSPPRLLRSLSAGC